MLKFAVVVCAVLWSSLAEAVKWDFDDGTMQGWSAKRALEWGGPNEFYLFPGEVENGVWRVDVSPSVVGEEGSCSECGLNFLYHRLRFAPVRPGAGPVSHPA